MTNTLDESRILSNRAQLTDQSEVDVRHPSSIWTDPENEQESLVRLVDEWLIGLKGRSKKPASPETLEKYRKSFLSFRRILERHQQSLVLGSLTKSNVDRWIADQRERKLSEDGIASRLIALKAFSHGFIYLDLELTKSDLLRKVDRVNPPKKPMPGLTESEREKILACFDTETFEDIRNKAFIGCYLATGLRFREVLELEKDKIDRISGEVVVRCKGGTERLVRISPKAHKLIKDYLRHRPSCDTLRLWVTAEGSPLTYWGGQSIFRRLKVRSGVEKLHAHLLRHTFAQVALQKGAERAAVQDMLGHQSDQMTRRYAGSIRQETAARMMPEFSPL